jgi:acyl carrier protein
MKTPAVIISSKFITVNFGSKTYMVNACDPKFERAVELYKMQSWNELHDFLNEEKKLEPVKEFTSGNIEIVGGEVLYRGKPVTGYVVDKIFEFKKLGYPYQPIINFLDNILQSHSWDVVRELYQFLERAGDMPITEDGAFLAYRKVDENYMSYHANPDGTRNRNQIGDVVEILPSNVDPDRNNECSHGLHFCSAGYLPHYHGKRGRVMRVKIFPQHTIAFPKDYNHAKGRCYKYEVVGECPDLHDVAFKSHLYTERGEEWQEPEDGFDAPEEEHYEITRSVLEVLKNVCNISETNITLNSTLLDDLGVDDLDRVEIMMALEDQHGFESDGGEGKWKTVQDVVDYVNSQFIPVEELKSNPKKHLDIDIINRIDGYLERHSGETITLRKINKSLKIKGFTVSDVHTYLTHMGYTVKQRNPYNQSTIN